MYEGVLETFEGIYTGKFNDEGLKEDPHGKFEWDDGGRYEG